MSTLFYYKFPFNLSAIYYYVYIVLLQTPLRAICQQYITMSTLFYYKLPFNLSAIYYYVYIVLLQTPLRAICQQYITMSTLFYYKLPLEQSVSNILLCLHCSITNSPQSNLSAIYYYVYIVLLQTPLRAICQQYITMFTLFYYKLPLEQSVSNILLCLHCYITNSP